MISKQQRMEFALNRSAQMVRTIQSSTVERGPDGPAYATKLRKSQVDGLALLIRKALESKDDN